MSWKTYYEQHTMSAQEAVKQIRSGDRVVVGHACGEPGHVIDAMVANAQAYANVEIVHLVAMGKAAYCAPGMERHFRHNALFLGGPTRDAIAQGRGDFTPSFFFEIPGLFSSTLPVDVALIQVTPPDENGQCSLGISVDYTYEAVMKARTVIAQVNRNMPFTCGQSTVPVEKISCFVPYDEPILELAPPKIGPVEEAIGKNVASLVRDGDTLQLGIGAIPDAVLRFLGDKKDLGIHSEMFSDGVVDLIEAGVVTNRAKTLHPGKSVVAFLMGTKRLYDYVDHNSDVELRPVDYVNHPAVIARNDNMVSINSCVQVDLMGQVCSESVGYKQISGTGGQVDFIRGAAMSKGGRSILAFPSTAAKGTISKIVPILDEGAVVTTSRNDVDYIVTEYGVAHLKGYTLRQRARALIQVAHPDFRPALQEEFTRRFHEAY